MVMDHLIPQTKHLLKLSIMMPMTMKGYDFDY